MSHAPILDFHRGENAGLLLKSVQQSVQNALPYQLPKSTATSEIRRMLIGRTLFADIAPWQPNTKAALFITDKPVAIRLEHLHWPSRTM